jgi:hypothetical protein
MTSKQWMLIALAVALGGMSLYLNKDWFAGELIQIHHRSHPARGGFFRRNKRVLPRRTPTPFSLPSTESSSSRRSKSSPSVRSRPTSTRTPSGIWFHDQFRPHRGLRIRYAMSPACGRRVQGATPDPLEPGVNYRLLIEAGGRKAQHDFVPVPLTP